MDTQFYPQSVKKIGILHPGAMGSSIAQSCLNEGHEVFWCSEQRTDRTRQNAQKYGMQELLSIEDMCQKVDIIFSICMGGGVMPNVLAVAKSNFLGIFVDCNHVGDLEQEQYIHDILNKYSVEYVESSIYGWPYPHENDPNNERTLYLNGFKADIIAETLGSSIFNCKVLEFSSKEKKRQRHEADKQVSMEIIEHGYGILVFPNVMEIDDNFIDEWMKRRDEVESQDFTINEDGFYVNRGGYLFTKAQIEEAPRRYLNLTPQGCPVEDLEFHKKLEDAMFRCIHEYSNRYPEVKDCLWWRSNAHLAQYGVGVGMGLHHDNAIGGASENENPLFNVVSASLILSDRHEGGEIGFASVGKDYKINKGSIIMYPSSYMGAHYVKKITEGERISYLEFFGHGSSPGQTQKI